MKFKVGDIVKHVSVRDANKGVITEIHLEKMSCTVKWLSWQNHVGDQVVTRDPITRLRPFYARNAQEIVTSKEDIVEEEPESKIIEI